MIEIKINQEEVKKLYLEKLDEAIKNAEKETLFWDRKELMRQTRMGWNAILEHFFHHPEFPKAKIGGKWYFPAQKCREFLLKWLMENPKYQNWKADKEV